jgi:RNA polymerase sigma-70 factor, ECF subfamily
MPDVARFGGPSELPVSEEELVEQAKDDPEAFAELYRRYVRPIHGFAYRRSGSVEVADEITSSTFERALRGLPSFRWRDGGFRAWLYRIAANELASHYRSVQRQRSDRGQQAARQLHEAVTIDEDVVGDDGRLVLEALDRLNERYQQVITLRYLSGLSAEEAAAAMGVSKGTLAVVLHRALRSLRRVVADGEQAAIP